MPNTYFLYMFFILAASASADQILENDIVEVGCYRPTDESCTGFEGMRMAFDLCCPCFRWSYQGDVSSTKKGEYTLGDDDFGWLSHITSVDCVVGAKGTANKRAGNPTCVQQTEGKTYRCKIQKITHRSETCGQLTPVCEQGPFPGDTYVSLAGVPYVPLANDASLQSANNASSPSANDAGSQSANNASSPSANDAGSLSLMTLAWIVALVAFL